MKVYVAGPLFSEAERAFLSECAAQLRVEGIDCFVPHEHLAGLPDLLPETIFASEYQALWAADAVLAILDGPQVDDGTACEIGIFYGLMQHEPAKKGIVGLVTDWRAGEGGDRLNRYLRGCLGRAGQICANMTEVVAVLRAWSGSSDAPMSAPSASPTTPRSPRTRP